MKKIAFTLLSIIALTGSIFAQSAEDVFKAVIDKTKTYKNIEIAFEYKMINEAAGINESMNGIGFMQGDAYKIIINNQEIISDGITLWTYLVEDKEVMVSSINEGDNNMTPLAILNSYCDNVKVNFINKNSDILTIEAKPNKTDKFVRILISLDKKSYEIKSINMFDNNGNEFVYKLNKFLTNQELPDNFFVFDETQNPDVEVIDMR